MTPPGIILAECLSVIPWTHVQRKQGMKVLGVGVEALPLVNLALRFPEVAAGFTLQAPAPAHGRAKQVPSASSLPANIDLATVAVPGSPINAVVSVRPCLARDATLCVALDDWKAGGDVRRELARMFPVVVPFRAHLPDPAVLFLCGSGKFTQRQPVPTDTMHLTDRYIPALFMLAKDEYRHLFQGT